jgi:hypothetical protein
MTKIKISASYQNIINIDEILVAKACDRHEYVFYFFETKIYSIYTILKNKEHVVLDFGGMVERDNFLKKIEGKTENENRKKNKPNDP